MADATSLRIQGIFESKIPHNHTLLVIFKRFLLILLNNILFIDNTHQKRISEDDFLKKQASRRYLLNTSFRVGTG